MGDNEYQFGREYVQSRHFLTKVFCNNLVLGQWSATKACLSTFDCLEPVFKEAVIDALYDFIACIFSNGWHSMRNKYTLAWPVLQEVKSRHKRQDQYNAIAADVKLKLLFCKLTLCEVSFLDTNHEFAKELYTHIKSIWQANEEQTRDVVRLSMSTQKYFLHILSHSPTLTLHLFDEHKRGLACNNQQLFALYNKCLTQSLEALSQHQLQASGLHNRDKLEENLLVMLSGCGYLQSKCDYEVPPNLWQQMITFLQIGDSLLIDLNSVCSALVGSPQLLQNFTQVHYDVKYGLHGNKTKLSGSKRTTKDVVVDAFALRTREEFYSVMFELCVMENVNFITIILDSVRETINASEWDEVKQIVKSGHCSTVVVVALTLAWDLCTSTSTAEQLLRLLMQVKNFDLQRQTYKQLQYQLNLAKWIKENDSSSQVSSQHQLCILHTVEAHSCLWFLHRTQLLSTFTQQQVIDLLQQPWTDPYPPTGRSTDSHDRTPTAVRFVLSGASQQENTVGLSHAQQILIDEYRAYCAIKHTLEAIHQCNHFVLQYTCGEGTHSDEEATLSHLQNQYCALVTQRLEHARQQLHYMSDVELCIEILENMFSFVFVTTMDYSSDKDDITSWLDHDFDARAGVSAGLPIVVESKKCSGVETDSKYKPAQERVGQTSSCAGSVGFSASGFIANAFVVRDIMYTVQIACTEVNEKFGEDISNEFKLTQRMNKLQHYVNEGLWKLQIVEPAVFQLPTGSVDSSLISSDKACTAEQELTSLCTCEVDISEVSDSSSSNSKSRRQHSKHIMTTGTTQQCVQRMLASPHSLLNMCLSTGQYLQAKEVVKIYNMADEISSHEVAFSKLYKQLLQDIDNARASKHSNPASPNLLSTPMVQDTASDDNMSKLREASIVCKAAVDDENTTCNFVEGLLSASSLPMFAVGELKSYRHPSYACYIEPRAVPAIVILDILCTAHTTWQYSQNLVNIANTRIRDVQQQTASDRNHAPSRTTQTATREMVGTLGLCVLVQMVCDAVKKCEQEPSNVEGFHDLVLSCRLPLNGEKIQCYQDIVTRLVREVTDVEVRWQHTQSKGQQMSKPAQQQADTMDSVLEKCERLAWFMNEQVPKDGICSWEFQTGNSEQVRVRYGYISKFLDHMNIIARYTNDHSGSSDTESPLAVLQKSLTELFGGFMFKDKLPIERLEPICKKLNVDLVSVILDNCASQLSSMPAADTPSIDNAMLQEEFLLNASTSKQFYDGCPNTLIENILEEVTSYISDHTYNNTPVAVDQMILCIQSDSKHSVFADTAKLSSVNLDLLVKDEDKLAFFINLHNLMIVHALFDFIKYRMTHNLSVGNNLLSDAVTWSVLKQQMFYCVGRLKKVSITDIKDHILQLKSRPRNLFGLANRWQKYSITHDCLQDVAYCLYEGDVSSPVLRIYSSENIENEMREAKDAYLKATVFVNDGQLCIPEKLTRTHTSDVTHSSDARADCKPDSSTEALLQDIIESLSADTQQHINSYLEQSEEEPHANKLAMTIPHNYNISLSMNSTAFTTKYRSYARQHLIMNTMLDHQKGSTTMLSKELYDYVINRSTLIASLLCFMMKKSAMCVQPMADLHELINVHYDAYMNKLYKPLLLYIEHNVMPICSLLNYSSESSSAKIEKQINQHVLLASLGSRKLTKCLLTVANHMYIAGKMQALREFLLMLPQAVIADSVLWQRLWDDVMSAVVTELCNSNQQLDTIAGLVMSLYDLRMCICTSLYCLDHCDVDTCLTVITHCMQRINKEKHTEDFNEDKFLLEQCIHKLKIYKKIYSHITVTKDRGAQLDVMHKWTCWQAVYKASCTESESVLCALVHDQNDYDHVRQWAALHQLDRSVLQKIEVKNLEYILVADNPDHIQALQSLEHLNASDATMCHDVCVDLLSSVSCYDALLFVSQYFVRHALHAQHPHYVMYYNKHLCYKMMLCIAKEERENYTHLVSHPGLMLEQALINMKIEWANQMIQCIVEGNGESACSTAITLEECDELLVVYASKAVEFPIVQLDVSGEVSSVSSQPYLLAGTPIGKRKDQSPIPSFTEQCVSLPNTGRSTVDYSRTLSVSCSPDLHEHIPSTPPGGGRTMLDNGRGVQATEDNEEFVMPPEPPTKEDWVPDLDANTCMVCKIEEFSMFNRRHHCRRCGRVVCGTCSTNVYNIRDTLSRVCDQCYRLLMEPEDETSSTHSTQPELQQITTTDYHHHHHYHAGNHDHSEHTKCLSSDEEDNKLIRQEFYYQQAPSTTLCLSLLELHSNKQTCADLLLHLCDDISKYLKSTKRDVRHSEVDFGLVINMLRHLLFSAKIMYERTSAGVGGDRCDLFLNRVDLLEKLILANVRYIPTIEQLTHTDTLRRLRDRLLQEEKYALAMDVSTKCGIDPSGVWAVWGMAHLRLADYAGAREKFSKCLKVPANKNQGQNPKVLEDILDYLQNNRCTLQISLDIHPISQRTPDTDKEFLYYLEMYSRHSRVITHNYEKHGLNKAVRSVLELSCSSDVFMESLVLPLMRNGHVDKLLSAMNGVDPSLRKWTPHITAMCKYLDKHKHIHLLYKLQIFTRDYIRAAMTCINYFYLHKAKSYTELHNNIQYIIDAKQHLKRYLSRSETTHSRLSSRGSAGARGATQDVRSLCMVMSPGEVNRYSTTLGLQIEVTRYLFSHSETVDMYLPDTNLVFATNTNPQTSRRDSTSGSDQQTLRRGSVTGTQLPHTSRRGSTSTPDPHSGSRQASLTSSTSSSSDTRRTGTHLPTLFGNTKAMYHVAALVILVSQDISDGFGLAFRIVHDFKADQAYLYINTARLLTVKRRYADVQHLVKCIMDSGLGSHALCDEVVQKCIYVAIQHDHQTQDIENSLISLLSSELLKMDAYIDVGKLRSAYLIAIKLNRPLDVERVAVAADRLGQTSIKAICTRWLSKLET